MTDVKIVKVEKRQGRWYRLDTGKQCTDDELHTAYYLSASSCNFRSEVFSYSLSLALTLTAEELPAYRAYNMLDCKLIPHYQLEFFREFQRTERDPDYKTFLDNEWKIDAPSLYDSIKEEAFSQWKTERMNRDKQRPQPTARELAAQRWNTK